MLLYRRWREADEARARAEACCATADRAGRRPRRRPGRGQGAGSGRGCAAALREEEAIAGAILQRLTVQREALGDQEARALARETLRARIAQLDRDMEREAGLNRDAGEVIERLDWESSSWKRPAHEGHDERLAEGVEAAREAGAVLREREALLVRADRGCGAAGGAAPVGAAAAGGRPRRCWTAPRPRRPRRGRRRWGGRGGLEAAGEAFASRRRGAGGRAGELAEAPRRRWPPPRRPRRGAGARGRSPGGPHPRPRARLRRCGPKWRRWRGWSSARRGGHQVLDRLEVEPGYEAGAGRGAGR
jgi:chromosome segregation protein